MTIEVLRDLQHAINRMLPEAHFPERTNLPRDLVLYLATLFI